MASTTAITRIFVTASTTLTKLFFASTTANAWTGSAFSTIVTNAYTIMASRAAHIYIYYLKLFFIFYNLFLKNNYFFI